MKSIIITLNASPEVFAHLVYVRAVKIRQLSEAGATDEFLDAIMDAIRRLIDLNSAPEKLHEAFHHMIVAGDFRIEKGAATPLFDSGSASAAPITQAPRAAAPVAPGAREFKAGIRAAAEPAMNPASAVARSERRQRPSRGSTKSAPALEAT